MLLEDMRQPNIMDDSQCPGSHPCQTHMVGRERKRNDIQVRTVLNLSLTVEYNAAWLYLVLLFSLVELQIKLSA